MVSVRTVRTPVLEIAYEAHGPEEGEAVVLLHGFPYDPRCFDEVAPPLAQAGYRVIVPFLRGYGPTRFLSAETPRSGQQAALAQDLLDLLDALATPSAALMGYDWGGRAACIVAALWPERARCLVTGNGYNIQNIPRAALPADPRTEYRNWYQYYFNTERGRAGLEAHRADFTKLLWQLWSPSWTFDGETFARTAASFDNPDFVDVVVHSYRHRYGYAKGDPAMERTEQALAAQPLIAVPTISLNGADDGVSRPSEDRDDAVRFSARFEQRMLPGVGHNIPQEAPAETVRALLDLMRG
ncbi:alpha/beta fold hydrolase [Acidisoma sp.]|uniref:alpha/beta fold hydrolase n=1 Tax=Acidisoma sp. TaxID=1872115 RepID=UPI003B00280C